MKKYYTLFMKSDMYFTSHMFNHSRNEIHLKRIIYGISINQIIFKINLV